MLKLFKCVYFNFGLIGKLQVVNLSNSSKIWLKRQNKDPFVIKAKHENYRCRSAFKLVEIIEKYKIIREGDFVIDCGGSPGSWAQVAAQYSHSTGVLNVAHRKFSTLKKIWCIKPENC
ncbi:hypothetical protein A3Q56_07411 [Intoshia linei]|uniref:rRNA methyltransferase 2, mitochondrial n=1 Tax=Intoshia linei TaxID=1819745 RepID=A0A177ASA5_9BILA|nr:hypothetical protein A3Q56_07411 [Intoshia linei]